MNTSPIKAILFDADGVILDSEKLWDRAQVEFSRRRGLRYDRDRIKPLLAGTSQTHAMEFFKTEYNLTEDVPTLIQERMALVKAEFEAGIEFMRGFQEFHARVSPAFATCVATSMPEELLAVVDRKLGLSRLFRNHVYSLKAVGYRAKPNPDIFLHAASQLGVPPTNCLVIEDAPNGIEAAKRAGMRSVALATTFSRNVFDGATTVVDSFREIDLTLH
jgi:beta-phosphoglucomutase